MSLFIILFNVPWGWACDYAEKTAHFLGKSDVVICYMQFDAKTLKECLVQRKRIILFRKLSQNIYEYVPLYIFPFRRFKFIQKINSIINILILRLIVNFLQLKIRFIQKYVWTFYPGYLDSFHFFGRFYKFIYDCVDYYGSYSPEEDCILAYVENSLILMVDYFFVNSKTLYDLHKSTRIAVLVPQGFRYNEFQIQNLPSTLIIPRDKPIVGYIGGINYRLNYKLLINLVMDNPQYNFVFIGPIEKINLKYFENHTKPLIDKLFSCSNCLSYPKQPADTLLSVIEQFDIGIIPYDLKYKTNVYSYPMKLFEYFYAGKPVISTSIKELLLFPNYVKIADTYQEWSSQISCLLKTPWNKKLQQKQRDLAIANSWERKIETIVNTLN
jgi:glycosyltransferase involved in cell wall biosynthesis